MTIVLADQLAPLLGREVVPDADEFVRWQSSGGGRLPCSSQELLRGYAGSRLNPGCSLSLPDGSSTSRLSVAMLPEAITQMDGLPRQFARLLADGSGNWLCVACEGEEASSIWYFDHDTAKLQFIAESLSTLLGAVRKPQPTQQSCLEMLRTGLPLERIKADFEATGDLARDAIDAKRLDVLEWAVDSGATRTNLLHLAGKWSPALDLLLARGYSADSRDKDGMTPLMYAARAGRLNVVEVLLRNGADPSIRDSKGREAVWYARKPAVEALLESVGK